MVAGVEEGEDVGGVRSCTSSGEEWCFEGFARRLRSHSASFDETALLGILTYGGLYPTDFLRRCAGSQAIERS